MADRWRFVSSIAASPTVRLDLNDLTIFEVIEADLTPPSLRRQTSASMLADGDHISASAFNNREVALTVELVCTTQDLAATERQKLERELARATNILEYRPHGATASVFFRTFRSSMSTVTRMVGESVYYAYEIPIAAEPFAYGLKETLSNVTLAQNPNSANGLNFTLTAANIKGDVETPLNLKFADASKFVSQQMVIGIRRRGTPANMPFVFQCEAMTNGTATTDIAGGATFSPASGTNGTETTTALGGMTTILTQSVPTSATVDARGQYRVFYRCRSDDVDTVYEVGFAYDVVSSPDETTLVDGGVSAGLGHKDLGILSLPQTQDPVYDGPTGVELEVLPGDLKIMATDIFGTGNLESDYVVLMPADDIMCFIDFSASVGMTSGQNIYLDSYNRRVFLGTADGNVDHEHRLRAPTAFPMVTPNQDNRICVIPGQQAVATTYTVTPSYWPRYIDVRPAST